MLTCRIDYEKVQKVKRIDKYLQRVGMDKQKNRMCEAFCKKLSATQIDKDLVEDVGDLKSAQAIGNKIVIPKGSQSKDKYCIMITAKDLDYTDDDDEIIDQSYLLNSDLLIF